MKELPKELTVEFLSLVLNETITKIFPIGFRNIDGEIEYAISKTMGKWVNIDTLTRLMKEWCNGYDYDVLTCLLSNNKSWCQLVEMKTDTFKGVSQYFHSDTEFEAVLEATHWVATEKGLI